MNVLIWLTVAAYSLLELVYGDDNPYKQMLLAQPWESVTEYVTVRPGAHMFYWFYYADGTRVDAHTKPLIIWIQGGPGYAASGIGNFVEIGPFDVNMQPRRHTWVKGRNLLLIDHPVGTGFSYVRHESLLAKTDKELTFDLVKLIKAFMQSHVNFQQTPTFIFGQSYGAKICTRLAYYLYKEIRKDSLKMNLKGIGLGSAWVAPHENILMMPRFCFNRGLIDRNTYLDSLEKAKRICNDINQGNYNNTLTSWIGLYRRINEGAGTPINFEHINQKNLSEVLNSLQLKINSYVKPMLSNVVDQAFDWSHTSDDVYLVLNQSLLMPSTKYLEALLNETNLHVAVYNGNLDVITTFAGTSNWLHKLKFHGSEKFKNAPRHAILGSKNGFYKTTKRLSFWWVFRAGHRVAKDNPEAMEQILNYVTSNIST